MRILITAVLVLSFGFCLAEDLPESDRLFPKSNKVGSGLSSKTGLKTELNAIRQEKRAAVTCTAEQARLYVTKYNSYKTPNQFASLTEDFTFYLERIRFIDRDAAHELAKKKYLLSIGTLSDGGMAKIDKETAAELATHKGSGLSLGLKVIDKAVASELAKFGGDYLSLRLISIDVDVARELIKFQGESLYLDSLTSINKDVAQEFAKWKGRLSLCDLRFISKEAAKELAKFEGEDLCLETKAAVAFEKLNPRLNLSAHAAGTF